MSAMDYAANRQPPHARQRGGRGPLAVMAVVFGWRSDRRKARLAARREREMELEIARLRAVGGF